MENYFIKQIGFQDTFVVRHPVLRPGKPVESCKFEGDNLPRTIHFGVFENDLPAGVVSVFEVSHPEFAEERQFQLEVWQCSLNIKKSGWVRNCL